MRQKLISDSDVELWRNVFLIDDSSESGLKWSKSTGPRCKVGSQAGYIDSNGAYFRVCINKKMYPCHVIIWCMINGPKNEPYVVDHIDGDTTNNNVKNLRLVTRTANNRNAKKRSDNSSGVTGVCWHKDKRCWVSSFHDDSGKCVRKDFSDFNEAVAYRKEMIGLIGNYSKRHGK